MKRILFGILLLPLSACRIEGQGYEVLVCHGQDGSETYRSERSARWYAINGTWHSYDGAAYRQGLYESCGTRAVSE